ncbi:MAG: right-handed parallel beta-helix repeat-containing protein [Planctomycetota bacterium]
MIRPSPVASGAFLALLLLAAPADGQGLSGRRPAGATRPATEISRPANVHYVNAAATGANDGSRWADAFLSLQSALAAAQAGEEIWVAAGTYTPSDFDETASFVLKSGVALYGGFAGGEIAREQRDWDANPTLLSGDIGRDDIVGSGSTWYLGWNITTANSGHVVVGSGTDASAILDGFSIENGNTGPPGTPAGDPLMYGGGLYNVAGHPTVKNCTFRHNLAAFAHGAAIYNLDSSPSITACRFLENYVHLGDGGGIFDAGTSAPVIADCVFARNLCVAGTAAGASGGGLSHESSVPLTVSRCTFDENWCRPFFPVGDEVGYGGGLSNSFSPLTVVDCTFTRNEAQYGGGLMTWGPTTVVDCLFTDNRAVPHPNDPYPELGGTGAGLMISSFAVETLQVLDCTIAYNHGKKYTGLFGGWNSTLVVANSILWGNDATSPEVLGTWRAELAGAFDASYCCIALIFDPPGPGEDPIDPADLPGCIDLDPRFVLGAPGGDLRLAAGSPCIDAGDNLALPPTLATDLDGHPRRVDDPATPDTGRGTVPIVDMGAFEHASAGAPR